MDFIDNQNIVDHILKELKALVKNLCRFVKSLSLD